MDWNKYIKWGTFTSTNGVVLKYKWEFDRLNNNFFDRNIILSSILSLAYPYDIVGIHTVNPLILKKVCKAIYYPNTNISEGIVDNKYVLYDDVVTTGTSMLKAIEKYNKKPEKCICIVDRRDDVKHAECKGWNLDIISIISNVLKINLSKKV